MPTRLGDLDEAAVLAAFEDVLPHGVHTVVSRGDDAAELRVPGERLVITTDSMIEHTDFYRQWSTPFDLGWKLVAVNLADVAAMGAVPLGLVVAVGAPADYLLDDLVDIARGMSAAVTTLAPGVGIVGGDLARARALTLVATATGYLEHSAITRAGARSGDVVAVAGDLGRAYRGFLALDQRGRDVHGAPDASRAQALRDDPDVQAQLRPQPPIGAGLAAASAGAHALIDVSDGLVKDALRIARASSVRIVFNEEFFAGLPESSLWGGEDHALLGTFDASSPLPPDFVAMGIVESGEPAVWLGQTPLDERGWETFRGQL